MSLADLAIAHCNTADDASEARRTRKKTNVREKKHIIHCTSKHGCKLQFHNIKYQSLENIVDDAHSLPFGSGHCPV